MCNTYQKYRTKAFFLIQNIKWLKLGGRHCLENKNLPTDPAVPAGQPKDFWFVCALKRFVRMMGMSSKLLVIICSIQLPNSRFAKLPNPAIDWKIWKAQYSRGWVFVVTLLTF